MDKTISAAEANRQFSRVLREVREHGATYVVTSHGEPVARIGPPAASTAAEKELAKQRLLERLRSQPALNSGPWSRDEAYDDDL
jgi:prevent-host-death family protein